MNAGYPKIAKKCGGFPASGFGSVVGAMEDPVQAALRKAAARAERLAVLDFAKTTMERLLNIPMENDELTWCAEMKTPTS